MRNIFLFQFILVLFLPAKTWSQNKVKWETKYDIKSSEIVIYAKIEKSWHLYSINNSVDLGPVPTQFYFPKQKGLKLQGKIQEQQPIVAFDSNFGATLGYHEMAAEFRQKVKLRKVKNILFTVTYMVCDDSQCLPPTEVNLTLQIKD